MKKSLLTTTYLMLAGCVVLSVAMAFSRYRAIAFTVFMLLGISLQRPFFTERISSISAYCIRNYVKVFLSILCMGLIERVVIGYFSSDGHGVPVFTTADYSILWNQAGQWAVGNFVETKSWVTVGFYAFIRRLLGPSLVGAYLGTTLLQIVMVVLASRFVRVAFGSMSALIVSALIFCSPVVAAHVFNIATEHTYSLSVVSALYLLISAKRPFQMVLLGVVCLLALWSRGEGILLIPVCLLAWVVEVACRNGSWRGLFVRMSFLGGIVAIGFCCAAVAHRQQGTSISIFCSDDNLWPRLFGANFGSRGYYDSADKRMIIQQYLEEHELPESWNKQSAYGIPEAFTAKCPVEVVPYVKAEISRRWKEHGIAETLVFVLRKVYFDLSDPSPFPILSSNRFVRYAGQVVAEVPVSMMMAFLLLLALRNYRSLRSVAVQRGHVALPILLLIYGQLMLLMLTEVSARYIWLIHVIMPICLGWLLCSDSKENNRP